MTDASRDDLVDRLNSMSHAQLLELSARLGLKFPGISDESLENEDMINAMLVDYPLDELSNALR